MCPVWGFGNLIALLDLLDYDSKKSMENCYIHVHDKVCHPPSQSLGRGPA